jgi:hypothetical protein
MLEHRLSLATRAIEERRIKAALRALYLPSWSPFVWPDTYEKVYWYQKVNSAPDGYPVGMRSTWYCLVKRYGKAGLLRILFERMLRLYKVTEVERPASQIYVEFLERFERKHGNVPMGEERVGFIVSLKSAVVVRGKIIPMDRDRIAAIEKAVAVIEKLEKLAA